MADTHDLSNVFDKAVAFSLYVRRYANRRSVDPRLVNSDLNQEWVGVSKRLLKSDELDAINGRDRQFRNHLSTLALPSLFRAGIWLIPNELLETVDKDLETYRAERDELVDKFILVYHSQIDKSREMLGSLFNERNYPDEDRMRGYFFIRAHYIEFGAPKALNKFRADIFQREQERIEKHWTNALEGCKALLRQTLGELLDHALDRLTPSADGKTKVIRKSMLEKLDGFVSTFKARNIADDEELAGAIEKIRGLSDGITTADLRSDESIRDKFKAGLANVKAEVDTMIEDTPKRAFMSDEE